jgi:hypothetical protein
VIHDPLLTVGLPPGVGAQDPAALSRVASRLAGGLAAGTLYDRVVRLGAASSLRQLGVTREQVAAAAPKVGAEAGHSADARAADIGLILDGALAGQRPT